eukprot:4194162-Lingulodinium_polyedra.AAC.1
MKTVLTQCNRQRNPDAAIAQRPAVRSQTGPKQTSATCGKQRAAHARATPLHKLRHTLGTPA